MGARKSSRRKGRRQGAQAGRAIAKGAQHGQLGKNSGRNRKTDRPAKTDTIKTQRGPDRPVSSTSQPDSPELGPDELADAVAAYAKAGVFNIPTIAERLGVSVARVKTAARQLGDQQR